MKRTLRIPVIGSVLLLMALMSFPLFAQMDPTGSWNDKFHEDAPERAPGPDIADYTGLPINAAARAKADSWKAAVQTLPERQCIPHPFPYSLRGPANLRIWSDVDEVSGQVIDWKMYGTFGRATHTVWMDGRPHPPKDAYYAFEGFTTGQWEGNTLTTYTDHIKMGYLRRNGVPTSDEATVIEHWTRHGDTLTAVVFVIDPIYLTEPYIRSSNWQLDPTEQVLPTPCEEVNEEDRAEGVVPHWLPGTDPFLSEISKQYGIPYEAVRGGAETTYPEYRKKIKDAYVAPAMCPRYCCNAGAGAVAVEGLFGGTPR